MRVKSKKKKLCAFISAIPIYLMIEKKKIKMAKVNFLCITKKLREKRLAPILIKELTRRINLKKI